MRILIAEDTPVLQRLHASLMARWGYEYDLASDGREAVSHARRRKGRYDLCIMDVAMPKMNGLEAAKVIRQELPYFPILGYSSDDRMRVPCLKSGMDDFLPKHSESRRLHELIRSLTVKPLLFTCEDENLSITTRMPMSPEELKELRELEKQGLAVLIVESGTQRFVVHKNIQNKMSHVLVGEGKELFEFLDRGENPANCHLYKANMQTNRLLLTPEAFAERIKQEDEDMQKYTSAVDSGFDADGAKQSS